jgi:hypothetical protein
MNTQIADVKRAMFYIGFAVILGIGSTRNYSVIFTDGMFYGALVLAIMGMYQASSIQSLFDDEEE